MKLFCNLQNTVLALAPCVLLLLAAPLRLCQLRRRRPQKIGWNEINILKVVVTSVLASFAAFECVQAGVEKGDDAGVATITIVAPFVVMVTMGMVLCITLVERRKGVKSSPVLVSFWLFYLVCGILRLSSLFRQDVRGDVLPPSVFIHYPCLLFAFILNLFVDEAQRDKVSKKAKICPEKNSSFLSQTTFWWIQSMIMTGIKRPLTQDDLWPLNREDQSDHATERFETKWNMSKKRKNRKRPHDRIFINDEGSTILEPCTKSEKVTPKIPKRSLFSALVRTFYPEFFEAAGFKLMYDILTFSRPLILKYLIQFISSGEWEWRGYFYATLLFWITFAQSILTHQHVHSFLLMGMRLRSTIISVIYKKTLRLSNSAKKSSTVGEIVNLMSVDAKRFMDLTTYIHMIWSAPFQIVFALLFLWETLGVSAVAGIGSTFVILLPANTYIAYKSRQYGVKQMNLKDERIKLMNEILNGIKVLKLYAWEGSFQDKVLEIRDRELAVLKKAAWIKAVSVLLWNCAPFFMTMSAFAFYVLSSPDNILDAEKVFVSLSLFNIIRFPLQMIPDVITNLVQVHVSLGRLQSFVNNTELDPDCVTIDDNMHPSVQVRNATFGWEEGGSTLKNVSLDVEEGSLVAVVGVVGTGKSSLLAAILGEMDKTSGSVSVRGSMSYVPQQAWIQNSTLKDNILFHNPLDRIKYEHVVDVCELRPDLNALPTGDQTEIGEKGINLSGGQKQRVSLARAVYQDTDVYLLDDPLSAVDSHVGKNLFDNVIGPQGLLKNKTRVLVTHGVGFLSQVDKIVVLVDGTVSEVGSYSELLGHNGAFAEFLRNYTDVSGEQEKKDEDKDVDETKLNVLSKEIHAHNTAHTNSTEIRHNGCEDNRLRYNSSDKEDIKIEEMRIKDIDETECLMKTTEINEGDKLVQDESVETGSVKLSVLMAYVHAVGPYLTCIILFLYFLLNAVTVGGNVWLSDWSNEVHHANSTTNDDNDNRNLRLGVYGAFGVAQGIIVYLVIIIREFGAIRATMTLHKNLLRNVLASPMSFFDTTPIGRITNRFSKDVDVLDTFYPTIFGIFLICLTEILSTILVISMSTPLFMVVILPLTIFYYIVQRFYVATSRQLKRLESVSRSPIFSHFGETITGATTIRAYGLEAKFLKDSQDKVDYNMVSYFPGNVANRWLAIRLDIVGGFVIFFAALFAVLGRDHLDPSTVGLSITYAMSITVSLNWMVRMACELEINTVSVERIKEYSEIPTEADWVIEDKRPSSDWPTKGVVNFNDYQVRYRKDLDLVIKGINCEIQSGEKIGIVGRTGAGKSSLTMGLFRILEAAGGSIEVDGVNISSIGLHDLRSKLTIIPQDPVLFSGTLRMNLDPFDAHTDSAIWSALEHAYLKEFVSSLPEGLLHQCSEGGENLSVGQRQLVCLTRALLRNTQVLILDEATAAVDLETDDLIQATIRTEFSRCTVLTIAHRLNTIMDYTRIMVLDQGMVKEFEAPQTLLKDQSSVFYGMAKDAGLV